MPLELPLIVPQKDMLSELGQDYWSRKWVYSLFSLGANSDVVKQWGDVGHERSADRYSGKRYRKQFSNMLECVNICSIKYLKLYAAEAKKTESL